VLLNEEKGVRNDLKLNTHYVLVNELIWKILREIYGGGPEIRFKDHHHSKEKNEKRNSEAVMQCNIPKLSISPIGL